MNMQHGVYIGTYGPLIGKTALIRHGRGTGLVLAQLDDVVTGLGYGWHCFNGADWRIC